MMLRRIGSAAAAMALASGLALPQEKKPAASVVQEKAGVTLIEIPVTVVGKDGRPVAGLTLGDFELTDDGKKQAISGLDVIDLSGPGGTPGAPAAVPPSARRLWLLVFDLTYTSPSGLVRARDGARRFVTEAMKPADLGAVGTLSVASGWRLLVNFTSDRGQLAAALDTLGLTGSSGIADPLSFAFLPPGERGGLGQSPEVPLTKSKQGQRGQDIVENLRDLEMMRKKGDDDLARNRVARMVGDLGGIGRALDSVRGRKHVLFFSEGFETRLLSGQMAGGDKRNALSQAAGAATVDPSTAPGTEDAAISGEVWKVDSDARFGSTATRERMLEALAQFNRSDAVLDAVDIAGLRSDADAALTSGAAKAGSGTDALFSMASATDGDFVRNANDLAGELGKIEERTSLVYLLLYQPRPGSRPGAFHALKVKVSTPGFRVLARSGYYEPRPYRNLSAFERILASGDLLTGGSREGEIPASLLAVPFASSSEAAQVPVVLEVPGGPLLQGDTSIARTVAQIYVYATDSFGALADYVASEMTLDLAKVRASLEAGGLKFFGTLFLPPGDYRVRALVRNGATGRSCVLSTSLSVPEIPGKSPVLLPPLFQEAPGRWLVVSGPPRADGPGRSAEFPFAIGGATFLPSVRAIVSDGAPVPVTLVTYNLSAPSARPVPLAVRAEVVAADGRIEPAEVAVSEHSDLERGGGRKVVVRFTPRGLSPGRYVFKAAVTDPASNRTAEASRPFEVQ